MTTTGSVAELPRHKTEEPDELRPLVEGIVAELIKSLKSLKLYDVGNKIVQTRLDQLEAQLRPFLAEHGELGLCRLRFAWLLQIGRTSQLIVILERPP